MHQTALLFGVTVGTVAPYLIFDAFWLPLIPSRESRIALFISTYGLSRVEEPFGDPAVLTDLIKFDNTAFWADQLILALSPAGACLDGCKLCVPYPCP